ncbi:MULTISPECIES: PAS domain-containing protein [Haloferax]|uniref:PAS domain-containing protein n=2 Tax=Haloferax TaxID=2251 RepID=A0A6G1YYT0_9EURY|nr:MULTISPECIES: PAS domain-containing protein [Haloferax]KAB1186814.1 PAS domain-containing protein [Haloferax sp. CBA1149]MRW79440.1 PAS domain-containing protein [Haloferax marinisediminis]
MAGTIRVLHVDDDPYFTELTAAYLERTNEHLSVVSATRAEDGLARLSETDVDCIVSDYDMPDQTGIEFLEAVRETHPELPFILFTGKGSEEIAADAISAGATEYIQKETGTSQYTVLANRITNSVAQDRARRRSERANHRRRQTLMRITDGFVEMDADLTVTDVNEQTVELTGLSREKLVGMNYQRLMAVDDSNASVEGYKEVIETGEPRIIEAKSDIKPTRWIEERIFPAKTDESIYVYFTDVTERKRRERQLQTRTRQLQGILDSVQAALWMRDTDHRFMLMNQNYRELFDIDSDLDVAGTPVDDLLGADIAELFKAHDKHALSVGEPVEVEETLETTYGTRVYLARITPLFDDDGEPFATAGAAVDITRRKEREQTLTALHSAAQTMEQSSDEQTVYETLVETAENVLNFDLVAVDIEQDGYLVQEAWKLKDDDSGYYERTSLDSNDTFAVRAYNSQETSIVDDLRESDITPADTDYRSAMTVPIGTFGTFQAVSSDVGAFDEYDQEFAELLVDHARVKLEQLGGD